MLRQGYYSGKSESEIASELCSEGTQPRRVVELPGNRYDSHTNPQDILLAFLEGSAEITIGGRVFSCQAGDRLLINGHVEHSGVVGYEGCEYLMTMMPTLAD
jgi:quercetin dioxygenase-like cupin family protein